MKLTNYAKDEAKVSHKRSRIKVEKIKKRDESIKVTIIAVRVT